VSTVGVETERWVLQLPDVENGLQLQVWDFAGQMEYYASHQLYLSDAHAIYLLVADLSRSRPDDFAAQLNYWLGMLLCKKSPERVAANHLPARIVFVGTHVDKITGRTTATEQSRVLQMHRDGVLASAALSRLGPFLMQSGVAVDYREQPTLDRLRDVVIAAARDITGGGYTVPRRYYALQPIIDALRRDLRPVPILSLSRLMDEARRREPTVFSAAVVPDDDEKLLEAAVRF
jgi:hypothetical protein